MQAPQAQSKVLNADGPGVARSRSLPTAGAFAPVARGLWRSIALCLSITLVLETGAGAQPAMPVAAQSGASAANQTGVSVDSLLPRYDAGYDIVTPVQARHGMVVSDHRLASEIGRQVLREGGNAVDAAVAVGYALAVVLPYAGNLGGGGFMLVHQARTQTQHAIDFRERAPAQARPDMFLGADGRPVPGRSISTHLAVGVPGTVAGLALAHARWGSMPLARLIAPAVALARDGFEVSPTLAALIQADQRRLGRWPATRAVFFRGDRPLAAGEMLVQTDLAASLEMIARDGPDAFYQGPIAQAIDDEMRRHGGVLGRADLAAYRVLEREPLRRNYRGYTVVSMPPPSSGGVHLLQILGVLEGWPLASMGAGSAASVHLMVEAMKHAYADRSEHLGDPDFYRVPQRWLLSDAHLKSIADAIDPLHAKPASEIRPGVAPERESDQTTHFSVADAGGNAVAVTYTLNLLFGAAVMAQGTGILLNDEMDDFAIASGHANAFGLTGGRANAIEPGKRPLSSMTPTLVLKDNRPWLVTGSPGGSRIITTVLQTIVNSIDFGMNPALAVHAPRVHHQWQPDELRLEAGVSPDTQALLRAMGHTVVVKPTMGRAHTIRIGPGGFEGAADPRNPDAWALGF
jgi:gamma-glutamyltranspeptidase / glutathione hydrolase